MHCMISIVVPVYKAEKYLDKCIDSILSQTFTDFELILVDDGSPDKSPQICDRWAEKDHRIRVIHKENGGVSQARNCGVVAAEGRYITFADSDDWVENSFLEVLYRGMEEYSADVVQCSYRRTYEDGRKIPQNYRHQILDEDMIKKELLPTMAEGKLYNISNARWNKLYKTELVKEAIQICDASISLREDFLMLFAVFGLCKKIVIMDTPPLYNYYFNNASVTGAYHPEYKYKEEAFFANVKQIAEITCDKVAFMENSQYLTYVYHILRTDWKRKDKRKEIHDILALMDPGMWAELVRAERSLMGRVGVNLLRCHMVGMYLLMSKCMKQIRKMSSARSGK